MPGTTTRLGTPAGVGPERGGSPRLSYNDMVLFMSFAYSSADILQTWGTFHDCARPVQLWLLVSYLSMASFRVSHHLGMAWAESGEDFLLYLRHPSWVTKARQYTRSGLACSGDESSGGEASRAERSRVYLTSSPPLTSPPLAEKRPGPTEPAMVFVVVDVARTYTRLVLKSKPEPGEEFVKKLV